jgi:pimeloyl-ACP methyl ester carboxylesterase
MTEKDAPEERILIVVVHGIFSQRKQWDNLETHLTRDGIKGHWYYYQWKWWGAIRDIVDGLLREIDQRATEFDRIVLVGHSAGGMLVRHAYLVAAGAYPNLNTHHDWWTKVSSIYLFASINRGFRPYAKTSWALGVAGLKLIGCQWLLQEPPRWFRLGWPLELERGSFFVTNLRLAWMKHFHTHAGQRRPFVVQFLGDIDGIVAREDVRDTEAFINSYTVEIPGADHVNLFDPVEASVGYPKILNAFRDPRADVDAEVLAQWAPTGPKLVVFVLHGIRDSNAGWVTDVAEEIEKRCNPKKIDVNQEKIDVIVDRSTYGWFSAIKFALPWVRMRNLPWFLDRYSYHFARNPDTRFHFVGHSNGTFILGTSLQRVPAMEFERVYLAGSVLPSGFPWKSMLGTRVRSVANQCSSLDWPVGVLCRSLKEIGFRDVGTGGYDGFTDLKPEDQTRWFDGDHGSPLRRPNQAAIVDYILNATPLPRPPNAVNLLQIPLSFRAKKFVFPLLTLLVVFVGLPYLTWWCWSNGHLGALLLVAVLLYAVLDVI